MPDLRLIALAVLLALAQAPPQQQPPPPQPPPRFRTETNLVRVDAYATKDGVPVHDMTAADFEVFEDNSPQKIESFEHIVVQTGGPPETRSEPTSVTAANALAADPRRRVFVIFLDTGHVDFTGSYLVKEPLIELMQRVMTEDDLVAIMTPEMSPSQLTFGRRTRVIEEALRENRLWGRLGHVLNEDEREKLYDACWPPLILEGVRSARAAEMIARRRERITLDSLQDLIRHMGAIREGRTAVIAVTNGWVLFRPNEALTTIRVDPATGKTVDPFPGTPPPVGVGEKGTLVAGRPTSGPVSDRTECDKDQMDLAMADNPRRFENLFGEANRANVSFYPIDPGGLRAFVPQRVPRAADDTPINLGRSVEADRALRKGRTESLQLLALNTDGIALVDSNDLRTQVLRAAEDLTSYYLMAYYSTNSRLDGKFRNIKVRSKRPGIEIRSRRGYSAPTAAEVARARTAAEVVAPEATAAVTRALGTIERDARAAGRKTTRVAGDPVVLHRGPSTGNQMQPAEGRIFPRSERLRLELEAAPGAPVWTGVLLDRNGTKTAVPVVTAERTDAATGQRWLTADITLAPLGAGDYVVELTVTSGSQQNKTLTAIRVTQ
jgi:VWFA-related protein